jgi:chemotaxis protein methyltransferase CheR
MSFHQATFDELRKLVMENCGVNLENDRDDLVQGLIQPSLESWGMGSLRELLEILRKEPQGNLARKVVETLVPGETYFFRDPPFYEVLETRILPELASRNLRTKRLRIWCCACSTGQEPYSLAMLIRDKFPFFPDWDFHLVASDFSSNALEQARSGLYNALEGRRGLSPEYLARFMEPSGAGYRVKEEVRSLVDYRRINLKDEWLGEESVDLLLMRNVLIYFEAGMKKKILARCQKSLAPEGYLFLGSSETALFLGGGFQSVSLGERVTGYHVRHPAREDGALDLESVNRLFLELWSTLLGVTPQPSEMKVFSPGIPLTSAYVRILGAHNLMVRLTVPGKVADDSARCMFGSGEGPVQPEQSEDALKEMVNILGGNIKGLTSKYHFLTIPSVVRKTSESMGPFPGETLYDRFFQVGDEPVHLAVIGLKGE